MTTTPLWTDTRHEPHQSTPDKRATSTITATNSRWRHGNKESRAHALATTERTCECSRRDRADVGSANHSPGPCPVVVIARDGGATVLLHGKGSCLTNPKRLGCGLACSSFRLHALTDPMNTTQNDEHDGLDPRRAATSMDNGPSPRSIRSQRHVRYRDSSYPGLPVTHRNKHAVGLRWHYSPPMDRSASSQ